MSPKHHHQIITIRRQHHRNPNHISTEPSVRPFLARCGCVIPKVARFMAPSPVYRGHLAVVFCMKHSPATEPWRSDTKPSPLNNITLFHTRLTEAHPCPKCLPTTRGYLTTRTFNQQMRRATSPHVSYVAAAAAGFTAISSHDMYEGFRKHQDCLQFAVCTSILQSYRVSYVVVFVVHKTVLSSPTGHGTPRGTLASSTVGCVTKT